MGMWLKFVKNYRNYYSGEKYWQNEVALIQDTFLAERMIQDGYAERFSLRPHMYS